MLISSLYEIFYQRVDYEGLTLSYFNCGRIDHMRDQHPERTTSTIPSQSDGVAKLIRSMKELMDRSWEGNSWGKYQGHIEDLSGDVLLVGHPKSGSASGGRSYPILMKVNREQPTKSSNGNPIRGLDNNCRNVEG